MNKMQNNSIKTVLFAIVPLIIVIAIFATAANFGIMTNTNSVSQQLSGEVSDQNLLLNQDEVIARIDINFGDNSDSFTVTSKNNTVYGFLLEAAKIGGYDIKATYYGIYDSLLIDSISNYVNGDDNKYWIYYINGESGSVGADKQIVMDNDLIEWKFEAFIY